MTTNNGSLAMTNEGAPPTPPILPERFTTTSSPNIVGATHKLSTPTLNDNLYFDIFQLTKKYHNDTPGLIPALIELTRRYMVAAVVDRKIQEQLT